MYTKICLHNNNGLKVLETNRKKLMQFKNAVKTFVWIKK